MRRSSVLLVCVTALALVAGAVPVLAESAKVDPASGCKLVKTSSAKTVIDGKEYGPKDGFVADEWECVLTPGSGEVGLVFEDPNQKATWGASYAISTEAWQLYYDWRNKAAANVYGGKRIIKVCTWYTRDGATVCNKRCSAAQKLAGGS